MDTLNAVANVVLVGCVAIAAIATHGAAGIAHSATIAAMGLLALSVINLRK